MKTIRVRKPRDPLHDEIQARLAAKRGAGKREPVPTTHTAPRVFRAIAASFRSGMSTVVSGWSGGR